jgi:hypothetical protein
VWRIALEEAVEIVPRQIVMMMMMQWIFAFCEGTDDLGLAEFYSQFFMMYCILCFKSVG